MNDIKFPYKTVKELKEILSYYDDDDRVFFGWNGDQEFMDYKIWSPKNKDGVKEIFFKLSPPLLDED
ncbi:hypothetical protein AAEX28_12385 [Lentisphaerota bacterium WC36G]|nr:hypothetical protein LJT99_15215 [Lentisphaerae bacterium WC36]